MRSKLIPLLLSILFLCIQTGCSKEEVVLAPVAVQPELGAIDTEHSDTVVPEAGVYGGFTTKDARITFLGLTDYHPIAEEVEKIKEGSKAIVVGVSMEQIPGGKSITSPSAKVSVIDLDTREEYRAAWIRDNDIEQFAKQRPGEVLCCRMIFLVPETSLLSRFAVQITDADETHVFSPTLPDEPVSGALVDYTNMCAICAGGEYMGNKLIVAKCEDCGKDFVCGHTPVQDICYACSVMMNRCTQCERYIDDKQR